MRRTLLSTCVLLTGGLAAAQEVAPLLGQPVPGLSSSDLALFLEGRAAFAQPLTESDGLGPIFNEPACGSCHNLPVHGGAGTREVTRFGKAGTPFDPLANLGGSLLQDQSLDLACRETVPPQADVVVNRVTPICFGAGLLETISDQDFIDNETFQPPHLSGFISWVGDLSSPADPPHPARFGWKGVIHNAISFSIDAGLNEMGLTSVFLPNENAPNGDPNLLAQCDTVADPEDHPDSAGFTKIDRFTHFQRFLAAPPQVPPSGMSGEALFNGIGCSECHRPSYVTGIAPEPALSGQPIHPYSDFLMHDMGVEADQIAQGNASETDMQTRALWGLRQRVSLMHDGDVTGLPFGQLIDACVQRHAAGEGAPSVAAYNALSSAQKDDLYRFLASLGQSHFDYEDNGGLIKAADNDRDEFDWFFIEPFFTGNAPGTFTVDDYAAVTDVQGDGDFDLREFGLFQRAFTGDLTGVDPPLPPEPGDDVLLQVRAGSSRITVAPGGLVRYEVLLKTLGHDNQGLGMVAFDLSFDGGALSPCDTPTQGPMANFVSPVGLSNPQGFGGTPVAGTLEQVGGAQNTIQNSFAPQPTGSVITGLGSPGSPLVVASGSLNAPMTPGTYTLSLQNPMVNLIRSGSTGNPFWEVQPAGTINVRNLTLVVTAGGPEVYCTGKVNSDGCAPEILWSGTPSLTGADDFHLRAKNAVAGETALVVLGLGSQNLPFMNGTLCVAGFIGRGATVVATGSDPCGGRHLWHFRQSQMLQMGLNPGDKVYAQWYLRDTAQTDGTGVGLSDALSFTIQ